MSLQIFTRARACTNKLSLLVILTSFLASELLFAWSIDLSRRRKELRRKEASVSAPSMTSKPIQMIGKVFPIEPKQDIVILNTSKGFVPNTLRVRKGERYTVHVVNVNKENKNISFVMDYFGEHHGTFYGDVRSFTLKTDQEGVYSFQCPETSFEGQMVVYKDGGSRPMNQGPRPTNLGATTLRGIASEAK